MVIRVVRIIVYSNRVKRIIVICIYFILIQRDVRIIIEGSDRRRKKNEFNQIE